jgi:hypothetical protein
MPRLAFLAKEVGVNKEEIGSYLTRNPYFLIQDLKDLKVGLRGTKNQLICLF